jgi:hypothetical protein
VAGEERWEALKSGVESAWAELKRSIDRRVESKQ